MKLKFIICILFLLIAIILVCCLINNGKNKEISSNIKDLDNVISVEMIEETEGGYIYHKTEDKQLIDKIVDAISIIEIKGKTNIMFSDSTRTYKLKLNNGTEEIYCFQGNNYFKDNINYETYNYEELMKIKIPVIVKE